MIQRAMKGNLIRVGFYELQIVIAIYECIILVFISKRVFIDNIS